MKAFRLWSSAVPVLLSLTLLSCAVGNSPVTKTGAYPRVLERAKKAHQTMIMHSGVDTFAVTSVVVEKTKRQFTVQLGKLDSLYQATLTAPSPAKKPVRLIMRDSASYT